MKRRDQLHLRMWTLIVIGAAMIFAGAYGASLLLVIGGVLLIAFAVLALRNLWTTRRSRTRSNRPQG